MARILNTRAIAAKLAWQIIDKGQSLDTALKSYFESNTLDSKNKALVQELVYGICRWYGDLDKIASGLLSKPIRNKDRIIHFILLVGLYQLRYLKTADHAAVGETVSACKQLNKVWAKNLVNGCLRTYQRSADSSTDKNESQEELARRSHPQWLVCEIEKAWPKYSQAILRANNQRPTMCLRVNQREQSRDDYLRELESQGISATIDPHCSDGLILDSPLGVDKLPGFEQGAVSVQDTAAQIACSIAPIKKGFSVLDACAAPGGKSAHILERFNNDLHLDSLDISERRCEQLHSTLLRLKLDANIFVADGRDSSSWPHPSDGYDTILIDAPCSGTGVIRRHPDIRHHRLPSDIDQLCETQAQLLSSLWPLLKTGGHMLYLTCSILPQENVLQIENFLAYTSSAVAVDFSHPSAITLNAGKQALQGVHDMDGFYYCLLRKEGHCD